MPDGERADEGVGIDLQADSIEKFPRLTMLACGVDEAGTEFFATEEDVGGDGEIVGEIQLLMDERDAVGEGFGDGVISIARP